MPGGYFDKHILLAIFFSDLAKNMIISLNNQYIQFNSGILKVD
jgi:hypothetical protein